MVAEQQIAQVDVVLHHVGRQIAGFNPVEPAAAVPEPQTWALMLAGLAGMTAMRRRSWRAAADVQQHDAAGHGTTG